MRTVAEVAREAPALGIDKVIDHLTPAEYQPDRMVLSYKEIYPRVSDIISRSPKAVIQALLILRVFENYAPFISAVSDHLYQTPFATPHANLTHFAA